MTTIPVHWVTFSDEPTGPGVYWDTALFEDLTAGRLWRVPGGHDFEHKIGPPAPGDGAVLVLPGRACVGDEIDHLNDLIGSLRWCLLYVTSDEERQFPLDRLARPPHLRVWLSYGREGDDAEFVPLGYRHGTRATLAHIGGRPRIFDWVFAGQVTHERRQQMADALEPILGRGFLITTEGFAQGVEQFPYLMGLASADVAPAPSGPLHVDSFRLYEALEAGCFPVPDARTPDTDMSFYWSELFQNMPWRPIVAWSDLPAFVDAVTTLDRVKSRAWWLAEKRKRAYDLDWIVSELEGDYHASPPDLSDRITVLISSSPIPSHPSAAMLTEVVDSVRSRPELATCEIFVMLDGVRPEQTDRTDDYLAYVDEVCRLANDEWTNVLPIVAGDHRHQARLTRDVLAWDVHGWSVTTEQILFMEHDTPLAGDIPFGDLTETISSGALNLVRLYHENTIPEPHLHLMLDAEPTEIEGVPIIRTAQWSQRPHLADTAYYVEMLQTYFGDESDTFVEDCLHGVVQSDWRERGEAGWERHRLGIYAPPGGYQRSDHLDGRGGDQKFPLVYEYPGGGTPAGAPRAMSERTD